MQYFHRAASHSRGAGHRVAIFPGSFNPVTNAHLAVATAALDHVQEVVFTLPTTFPHKDYAGASFDDRIAMLTAAAAGANEAFSVAACDSGLYLEIAQECRGVYGAPVDVSFICGRDAAERILNWEYPNPAAFAEFLTAHRLLIAARNGEFQPPEGLACTIVPLELRVDYGEVSSSEIRSRIEKNLPWEHLAPAAIADQIRRIYGGPKNQSGA